MTFAQMEEFQVIGIGGRFRPGTATQPPDPDSGELYLW